MGKSFLIARRAEGVQGGSPLQQVIVSKQPLFYAGISARLGFEVEVNGVRSLDKGGRAAQGKKGKKQALRGEGGCRDGGGGRGRWN